MGNNYRIRIIEASATDRQKETTAQPLRQLRQRIPHLRQIVRRHFPADYEAPILDLGCGSGALIYVAREMGYTHVRGVDISHEQVAAARALGVNSVQQADAMEVLEKVDGSSIDCVICFDFLEHLARNELFPLADSVHRVLRPAGCWIIHTANAESPFGMRIRYGDLTHELAFTRMSLSQLLLSSGFSGCLLRRCARSPRFEERRALFALEVLSEPPSVVSRG